jgi:predicted Na+-dependent transporter
VIQLNQTAMGWFTQMGSSMLLFFLVFGMSATVELRQLKKQVNNWNALLIGVCMQFLILPFLGFLVVKALQLPAASGITLLVVTSSPGGSYSNWWCSLFNAELSLSVTMTAISTLLSTIMLPTNLVLYARWTYSSAVVKSLDWAALFVSLIVVLGGIACGLLSSGYYANRKHESVLFRRRANMLGNLAGISLICLSLTVSSTDHKASLWSQDYTFYMAVALPAILGLAITTYLATKMNLEKPERVAVAVESCYQNTGRLRNENKWNIANCRVSNNFRRLFLARYCNLGSPYNVFWQ